MAKLYVFFCVLALWGVLNVHSATHNAPAPAKDCSMVILSMSDCLSFVTSGSTVKKPEGGCCAGLKDVLKTGPECICETFKNSGQLGIQLNMTKAVTLPSACGIKAPPLSACGLSLAPGASPAHSPKSSAASPKSSQSSAPSTTPLSPSLTPRLSPAEGPASDGLPQTTGVVPAPAPAKAMSGASAVSISFLVLFGMVVASCSHI